MLASKLQTIRLLNGIRMIHMERINGYNKALAIIGNNRSDTDPDHPIEQLLSDFVRQSNFFAATLENIVLIEGGKMPYGIKVDQQLYGMIRELNSLFNNMQPVTIAESCRACENILHSAYNIVLNEKALAADPKGMLERQQKELTKMKELVNGLKSRPGSVLQAA